MEDAVEMDWGIEYPDLVRRALEVPEMTRDRRQRHASQKNWLALQVERKWEVNMAERA